MLPPGWLRLMVPIRGSSFVAMTDESTCSEPTWSSFTNLLKFACLDPGVLLRGKPRPRIGKHLIKRFSAI